MHIAVLSQGLLSMIVGSNGIFQQNLSGGLTIRTQSQSFPQLAEYAKTTFRVEKISVLSIVPYVNACL